MTWLALMGPASVYGQGQRSGAARRPATIDDIVSQVEAPDQIAVSPDSAWVAVAVERPATPGERYRDMWGLDRDDIWLFSTDGRVRRNLTLGKTDASGWFEPVWSPDGKRLAMLSTRGADGNRHLYVWDRRRDRLSIATTDGVSFQLALQVPRYQRQIYCRWLHAPFAHYSWSNDTTLLFLAFPDSATGDWHALTEAPRSAELAWAHAERGTAPTASVLDAGPGVPPPSFAPLELTEVEVNSHATRILAAVPMGDYREVNRLAPFPATGTISPDGHTLALLTTTPMMDWPASASTSPCCYLAGSRLALVTLGVAQSARWITLDSVGFFGTDGETNHLAFNQINCGAPRPHWTNDGASVLVHVPRPTISDDRWYSVSVNGSLRPVPIQAPAVTAEDTAPSPTLALTVQTSHAVSDRYDLVVRGRDTVMTLNANGTQLDPGRRIAIPYRGAEGDSLVAVLELPVGYAEGQRYPMITVVYDGSIQHLGDTIPSIDDALWAAHGYLVLYPSMPAHPGPKTSDVLIDVPKGVFPAIDRVIALGYADPDRLGVTGSSFGGFSTYVLIAYSDRFKAAIAESGPTDWTSYYGTFPAPFRYRDVLGAPAGSSVPAQSELDGPPWAILEQYVRNSPITYVTRIHTPVMIVHGDMDPAVPLMQSEEMFTALYRLGRRVEFVRYWGEGHWNVSPANIRDRWEREIKWFDTFLKPQATRQ